MLEILSQGHSQGYSVSLKGANNVDNGILMVMSNLTMFYLSHGKSVLSLGPAYRWGDVYAKLVQYDLTVAGGRLSPIGVPGLLLAGGINFYGNQYGFSCDLVVNHEVVLANGSIGGSSNFGITRSDLKTISSKQVWAGVYEVNATYIPQLLEGIAQYSFATKDPKSHIVPAIVSGEIGAVILFYDSETDDHPAAFQPFFDIPSIGNTTTFKTVAEFSVETGSLVVPDIRDVFVSVSGTVVGKTYEQVLTGIRIINDIFTANIPLLTAHIPAANISINEIDWEPLGALWFSASQKSNPAGNALGFDPSIGNYICYAQVVEWIGSEYDTFLYAWTANNTNQIMAASEAAGVFNGFHYIGDSDGGQPIFQGYGPENEAKLLSISRKYDPNRVFQTLMPGGFQIGL